MTTNTVDSFDEVRLKDVLINFDKKYKENQRLRIKHADDPVKFASSETELFAALDELQSLATQTELYHVLISKRTLSTFVSLIGHENSDISAKVLGMLQEFTDADDADDQEATEDLIRVLLEENVINLIIANLPRLSETSKEETQAIINSLAIIENIIDFDSRAAKELPFDLFKWMKTKLEQVANSFHTYKLSIAELLSVLLVNADLNKDYLRDMNGIDVILKQIDHYRKVAPQTGDEHEYLEQLVNCLCTAVLDNNANKEMFFEEQGVELIRLVLAEKRDAVKRSNIKLSMLKLFNHLLTTDSNQDKIVSQCCEQFVEDLGLRVLFPIFNNPKLVLNSKVKKREYYQFLDEVEEHTAAILLALLKYVRNTDLIQRVLIKLAESNFEKLARLVQLHDKYFKLVSQQEHRDDEDSKSDISDKAKSSAHFTLRTIDYILLLTCYLGSNFETYDPTSGETFTNHLHNKLLIRRPELRHQLVLEVGKHIDEVEASSLEECNSLRLLLEHFESCQNRH